MHTATACRSFHYNVTITDSEGCAGHCDICFLCHVHLAISCSQTSSSALRYTCSHVVTVAVYK